VSGEGLSFVRETFFAIVNPAAGGGRSGKTRRPVDRRAYPRARLARRRDRLHRTVSASALAREAYAQDYRRFLAVVGDGSTAPEKSQAASSKPTLERNARISPRFSRRQTGNSFLTRFAGARPARPKSRGCQALLQKRKRSRRSALR